MSKNTADIAVIISDLGSGGAQKIAVSLCDFLQQKGRKVCVITLSGPAQDFFTLPACVQRICLDEQAPSRGLLQALAGNARRIYKLRAALRGAGVTRAVSFIGATNILTLLAAAGTGIPVVISERNDPARQDFGVIWNALRRALYPLAARVTVNSAAGARALGRYVPQQKLVFIPNQLPPPPERALRPPGDKERLFLCVGRLHPQKGQDVLLQAFARVFAQDASWRLAIAGHGPLEASLKAQAQRLGIAGAVDFAGQVEDPYALYARARVFVLPSRYEGTPNALLEAMSCGLAPVVTNTCEGALEYVAAGVSGLVVPPDDAGALAAAMLRLADDPAMQQKLGDAARLAVGRLDNRAIFEAWLRALDLS